MLDDAAARSVCFAEGFSSPNALNNEPETGFYIYFSFTTMDTRTIRTGLQLSARDILRESHQTGLISERSKGLTLPFVAELHPPDGTLLVRHSLFSGRNILH